MSFHRKSLIVVVVLLFSLTISTLSQSNAQSDTSAPRLVAYTVSEFGQGTEIYTINADGSNPRQLTNNQTYYGSPSWSPDGMRLAFSGVDGIYVMNADGSNLSKLRNAGTEPTWSPDGSQIAFVDLDGGNFDIYVMNADGTNEHRLTSNQNVLNGEAWSPDGRQIAYASSSDDDMDIYVINADGSGQQNITNNDTVNAMNPSWSPDGSHIAFESERVDFRKLYIMNADGSNVRPLTDTYGVNPAWSPDGSVIAFTARDGEISLINVDGTNMRRLTPASEKDIDLSEDEAAWQPIAYTPPGQPAESLATSIPTPQPLDTNAGVGNSNGLDQGALNAIEDRLDPPGQEFNVAVQSKLTQDLEIPYLQASAVVSISESLVVSGATSDAYCVALDRPLDFNFRDYDISMLGFLLNQQFGSPDLGTPLKETNLLVLRQPEEVYSQTGDVWRVVPASAMTSLVQDWNSVCGIAAGSPGFYVPPPTATPTATPSATPTSTPVAGLEGVFVYGHGNDLYQLMPDGQVKQLTNDPEIYEMAAAVSPRGDKVAYIADDSTQHNMMSNVYRTIEILDLTTGDHRSLIRPLNNDGFARLIDGLAWSPDGSRIAFTETGLQNEWTLSVVNVEGRAREEVIAKGQASHTWQGNPAWSLDGTQIYAVSNGCSAACIRSYPADGIGRPQNVLPDDEDLEAHNLALSPDGTKLAFFRLEAYSYWITVYDFTTQTLIRTDVNPRTSPFGLTWSPDGTRLVVSVVSGIEGVYANGELYSFVPAEGAVKDVLQLTTEEASVPSWVVPRFIELPTATPTLTRTPIPPTATVDGPAALKLGGLASPLYLEPRRSGSPVISLSNVLLPLTGVTPDGRWYRVVYQDQVLWIERSGFNQIQGDINAVPVVEPPTAVPTETLVPTSTPTAAPTNAPLSTATPTAAPTSTETLHVGEDGAEVYAEPNPFSRAFASAQNVDLQIIGITSDGKWYQVQFEGQVGWIEKSIFVRIDGDLSTVPVIDSASLPTAAPVDTSSPTAAPAVITDTSVFLVIGGMSADLHVEANRSSAVTASVTNADLPLTGITSDGKWYRVVVEGQEGWIEKSLFNRIKGDIDTVPIMNEPASAPTTTSPATAAPTAASETSTFLVIGGIGTEIHAEPSRSSAVIASVESVDLPLTGITSDGKWYRVMIEGQEGWVEKSLFNRIKGDIDTVPVI